MAAKVICTGKQPWIECKRRLVVFVDHSTDLLRVVEQNMALNLGVCRKEWIQVENFDWTRYRSDRIDDQIEIVLAADRRRTVSSLESLLLRSSSVIYDDDLTDALFNVLTRLFHDKLHLRSIYLTIEKRINFYAETRSVQCPAYEYFLEKLRALKAHHSPLIIDELPTDDSSIKRCTSAYQRTKELVSTQTAYPPQVSLAPP